MRVLLVALLLSLFPMGLCASTPEENSKGNALPDKHAPAASAAAVGKGHYCWADGHYWYRSAGGQWFLWTRGQWVRLHSETGATTPQTTATLPAPVYRTSKYPPVEAAHRNPKVEVSYPDNSPDEVVNGIDWYLNGRGPFSD